MTDDATMTSYKASLTAGSGPAWPVAELEQRTKAIPSMGGRQIGSFLRELARTAPPEMSIVEVGCWLGAGTARLALGVRERDDGKQPTIHCFDRWHANSAQAERAQRGGVSVHPDQDILPIVLETMKPFGVNITFTKGDINHAIWDRGPISVHIDDAAKTPPPFKHMLQTFGPSWVPGVTVVLLMDYNYWMTTGLKKHEFQKHFVEAYLEHFTFIQDFGNSGVALRYERKIDFTTLE